VDKVWEALKMYLSSLLNFGLFFLGAESETWWRTLPNQCVE